MIRDTSLASYEYLRNSGLLQIKCKETLTAIMELYHENPNMKVTDADIASYLGRERCSVNGRRLTLEKEGIIYSGGMIAKDGHRSSNYWLINTEVAIQYLEQFDHYTKNDKKIAA